MGVKLDWDIEAEKGKLKEHREDKKQRSARYLGVFRLFVVIAAFAAILGGVVYLVMQRWEQVNQQLEQLLVDTVQAEVAALRVGDLTSFEERQRSATADWASRQRQVYDDYQSLKVESNVVLSGQIANAEIDGQRGRIQVEEIIDGVPYIQTWYYWRYEDGWYHVPPDYTFWGEADEIVTDDFVIRYKEIDSETATQIETALKRWLADTCVFFDCSTIPLITIDILPAPNSPVSWADNEQNAWQMVIPSPYTGRARSDMPFDTNLQIEMATLLAERIVSGASPDSEPIFAADAAYMRETIIAWLVGRFVQLNPETHLMQSLIDHYGTDMPKRILQNIQATSNISLLATVTGHGSVAEISADWRDFVLWRLELEDDLIERGDEGTWSSLYDFTDPSVQGIAYQRYLNNFTASERSVISANVLTSEAGQPQLIARVNVTRGFESGEEIIVFNLINGNWLRAN